MPFRRSGGFTVIELMVVVVIMSVLVAIALPSFTETMRTNRVASASNLMMATFAYARTEAIRSKTTATVCPREKDGMRCGSNWNDGMLVWSNDNGDANVTDSEVRRIVEPPAGVEFTQETAQQVSFDARGRVAFNATGEPPPERMEYVLQAKECKAGSKARRVIRLNPIGQITIKQGECQ